MLVYCCKVRRAHIYLLKVLRVDKERINASIGTQSHGDAGSALDTDGVTMSHIILDVYN